MSDQEKAGSETKSPLATLLDRIREQELLQLQLRTGQDQKPMVGKPIRIAGR